MSKVDAYRSILAETADWKPFLLAESNLPGPRANLELIYAVAATGKEAFFKQLLSQDKPDSSGNSPEDFLMICAVVGLGRLVAEGKREYLEILHHYANDRRWRLRESVAMALQLVGDKDINMLIAEMRTWSEGTLLEKRAAAAALCEPRLLKDAATAASVLDILDCITQSLLSIDERKKDDFAVLKQGLSYCWSVAIIASPEKGKGLMEKWIASDDRDILQIMKENLSKNRLAKMDSIWVSAQQTALKDSLQRTPPHKSHK